jgi:hypothetical protein
LSNPISCDWILDGQCNFAVSDVHESPPAANATYRYQFGPVEWKRDHTPRYLGLSIVTGEGDHERLVADLPGRYHPDRTLVDVTPEHLAHAEKLVRILNSYASAAGTSHSAKPCPTTLRRLDDDLPYILVRVDTDDPELQRTVALVGAWDLEGERYARMISAVPKLLAACQAVVDRWEHGDLAEAARMCDEALHQALDPGEETA